MNAFVLLTCLSLGQAPATPANAAPSVTSGGTCCGCTDPLGCAPFGQKLHRHLLGQFRNGASDPSDLADANPDSRPQRESIIFGTQEQRAFARMQRRETLRFLFGPGEWLGQR